MYICKLHYAGRFDCLVNPVLVWTDMVRIKRFELVNRFKIRYTKRTGPYNARTPANYTLHSYKVGSMLAHHLRLWTSPGRKSHVRPFSFAPSFLPSILPSFLRSCVPPSLPSSIISSLSSSLHSSLPSFLPSFLPLFIYFTDVTDESNVSHSVASDVVFPVSISG